MTKLTDFITPSEADESTTGFNNIDLDMVFVKSKVSAELKARFKTTMKKNKKVNDLWHNRINKNSRSERDFTMTKELKWDGYTLPEVGNILWHFPHGKGTELTPREIIRCYMRVENPFEGLSQDVIDHIDSQTNPLLKAKEDFKKLLTDSVLVWGADATEANSGVPLYKQFMNQETVNVLFGPSGSGKSFITLDMAMHLALGKDWAGYKCKQKMAVLYICTESGSSFGKRAKAARLKLNIPPTASHAEFPFAYYPAYVDLLNNKEHLKLIKKLVDDLEAGSGLKCGLIVVDTLSAAFGGGNENSEDMTQFANNMAEIKFNKKASVLIVHHTGKDEAAGARGHSSLKCNIDTEIQVKSVKKGDKYIRSFSSTKQKDDESGSVTKFGLTTIELSKDEDGDPITTCQVVFEDDTEFADITPSALEDLSQIERDCIRAVYLYEKNNINPDMESIKGRKFKPKQIKALILEDLLKSEKDRNLLLCNGTLDMFQMGVLAKPERAINKRLELTWNKMLKSDVPYIIEDYQLVSDSLEQLEHSWNIPIVP